MSTAAGRVFRGCRALMSPALTGGKRSAAAAAAAPKVTKADAKPKALTGILKPLPVSEALRRFAGGSPELARSNAVKLVWDHIKANNLQDPTNKRAIICDAKLKTIFAGKDKVTMFEISKLLSPHFLKT